MARRKLEQSSGYLPDSDRNRMDYTSESNVARAAEGGDQHTLYNYHDIGWREDQRPHGESTHPPPHDHQTPEFSSARGAVTRKRD